MHRFIKIFIVLFVLGMASCGGSGNGESSNDNSGSDNNMEKKMESSNDNSSGKTTANNSNVPPSEMVDLTNKGVGPVKDVTLDPKIDRKLAVKGKEIYDVKCVACHAVDHKVIGPPQKGIMEKRTPEWVMNMIMNPTEMLEKDPIAKAMLEEFNGVPMLDQNITREEARAIVEYFRTL